MKSTVFVLVIGLITLSHLYSTAADVPGQTRVAKWQDDKKAALLLMFDDSMPSHVKNVVPELKKRGFVGTFYVNPGSGSWAGKRVAWEHDIPEIGMVYGNHTNTHKGILSVENGEEEVGLCNDVIHKLFKTQQATRLVSFGVPGVPKEKWSITKPQLKELLDKHNLVERPHVGDRFASINLKTSADMLKVVDKAIETGVMDSIAFHGVGGEWLSATVETFMELMDGLTARKEKLWITDHISAYAYETERGSAEVKVLDATEKQIRLLLSCKADPKLFDHALTLVTNVPAAWTKVDVTQGSRRAVVGASAGHVMFDALPSSEAIVLEPGK
ncbi:MAG: polysaccharide deacetylase family protein [Planctomycetota bacterium]